MRDEDNRALILAAGRTLFERNPGGFTMASVCRETGLSRAKVRRHFPTKTDLIAQFADTNPRTEISSNTDVQTPAIYKVDGETVARAEPMPPLAPEPPPLV